MNNIDTLLHEIMNPLSNVYNLIELSNRDNIDEFKPLILQSIDQIKSLNVDFAVYRKTGRQSVKYSMIRLDNLIEAVIIEYQPKANARSISMISKTSSCRIYSDFTKTKQILSNLISNAIKYNKDNGTIKIALIHHPTNITITIADSGIGLNDVEIKQLGTLFYRCKRINTEGTGLGISLVKKLIDILGWSISIKSKPLVGTTITIIIPQNIKYNI